MGVAVGVGVLVGVGVGVGATTVISVSEDPVVWKIRPSDKVAVPQTAEPPEAIAVTVVRYGL